jgi:hypothetical protein
VKFEKRIYNEEIMDIYRKEENYGIRQFEGIEKYNNLEI